MYYDKTVSSFLPFTRFPLSPSAKLHPSHAHGSPPSRLFSLSKVCLSLQGVSSSAKPLNPCNPFFLLLDTPSNSFYFFICSAVLTLQCVTPAAIFSFLLEGLSLLHRSFKPCRLFLLKRLPFVLSLHMYIMQDVVF